jgi:hypothetical protein
MDMEETATGGGMQSVEVCLWELGHWLFSSGTQMAKESDLVILG